MPETLAHLLIAFLALACIVAAWRIGELTRRVAQLQRERVTTRAELSAVRWLLEIERDAAADGKRLPQ